MAKNKVGKPLFYKSAKKLQEKVDEYFKYCEGEPLEEDGHPAFYKGQPLYIREPEAPSTAGLAYFCGFKSKQGLLNYREHGDKYCEVLDEAKMRMEAFCYQKLFSKDTFQGARFCLVNNHGVGDEIDDSGEIKVTVSVNGAKPFDNT